jgi:hypothetical protein
LITGRLFDTRTSANDVIVNEQLAHLLWADGRAVGRVFLDGETEKHVIGVAGNARTERVERQWPIYYQRADAFSWVLVRNDAQTIARLEGIIRRVAPAAFPEVIDLSSGLREQIELSLIGSATAFAVGLLALLLATVGTLGVFSYVVGERTREIGVRMALGARSREIVSMLMARVAWPLAGGLALGLLGAQSLGAILDSWLYGISPRDPLAYAAVLSVLAAAAVLATIFPARRALRVDPALTLRAE